MAEETTPQTAVPQGAAIAGFWRRIFALLIDSLFLALIGLGIASQFYVQLVQMGSAARWVGLPISLLYFTLLNSRISGGQTFGKFLTGIRVVGRSGQAISLPRAFLRSSVLWIPYYLNGAYVPPEVVDFADPTVAGAVIFVLVFGASAASVYLYIFNRRTRQSLHDLATGTFVVKAPRGTAVTARIWPLHVLVAVALLAIGGAAPFVLLQGILPISTGASTTISSLSTLREKLSDPKYAAVSVNSGTVWANGTSWTFLQIEIDLADPTADQNAAIRAMAAKVLALEPDLMGHDRLQIAARTGFNIGIAGFSTSSHDSGTKAEWQAKLAGSNQSI